jgi:hypothetical protein
MQNLLTEKIEKILESCNLDIQVFTTIDWIYRLNIPENKKDILINKAQEKINQIPKERDNDI